MPKKIFSCGSFGKTSKVRQNKQIQSRYKKQTPKKRAKRIEGKYSSVESVARISIADPEYQPPLIVFDAVAGTPSQAIRSRFELWTNDMLILDRFNAQSETASSGRLGLQNVNRKPL